MRSERKVRSASCAMRMRTDGIYDRLSTLKTNDGFTEAANEIVRCCSPEITEDNFEDLLAIDDVLLDYFNAFLALPVFPHPLYYNRLAGTFLPWSADGTDAGTDEVVQSDGRTHRTSRQPQQPPPYGATDEEREKMLKWAKDERLPMFFRTRLFREYKLCRLLLRALDDRRSTASAARARHSAMAGFGRRPSLTVPSASSGAGRNRSSATSSMVRGYSRQTAETCSASSLSNSVDNSGAKDADDDDEAEEDEANAAGEYGPGLNESLDFQIAARRSALFRYLRPGSRAYSHPVYTSAVFLKSPRLRIAGRADVQPAAMAAEKFPATTGNEMTKARKSADSSEGPAFRSRHRRLDTSSDDTSEQNMLSDAMTSAYDTSESEAGFLIADAAFKLQLNLPAGTDDQQSTSCDTKTDSSAAEYPAAATPIKTKSYDILYEDAYNEELAADGIMTSVAFAGDVMTDAQAEEGVKSLEAKHRMSLQGMKELVLGSVSGMTNFRKFLQLTVGRYLYDFWLDCEFYKDTVEDLDDDHHRLLRCRLFKDIQEKYKLALTRDAVQQFMYAASHFGLRQTIFAHAQYSVLRRLRSYWVPRYLIHLERVNQLGIGLQAEAGLKDTAIPDCVTPIASPVSIPTGIFPSVTVVDNHFPAKNSEGEQWSSSTDQAVSVPPASQSLQPTNDLTSTTGSSVGGTGHRNTKETTGSSTRQQPESSGVRCNSLRERFLSALRAEKDGGGPLQLYLQRCNELDLLCNLLFWQEVTDYQSTEAKASDKQSRDSHAWDIFNKYLAPEGFFRIGLPPEQRDKIHRKLVAGRHIVSNDIFRDAVEYSEALLEEAWVSYVKQDFKTYVDSGQRKQQIPSSRTDIDFEVKFDVLTQQLIVAAPETKHDSGESYDVHGENSEMTEIQRAIARQKRLERRKVMERERRKAIRAAKKRLKEAKLTARSASHGLKGDGSTLLNDYEDSEGGLNGIVENPTFLTALVNKGVMASFRKHLTETNNKEVLNAVSLFTDIETYNGLGGGPQEQKKKDEIALNISRLYLQPGAKKKLGAGLSQSIGWTPASPKDRPRSPVLRKLHAQLQPLIDASFDRYCTTEEFNSKYRSSPSKNRQHRISQEAEFDTDVGPYPITVSIGVTSVNRGRRGGKGVELPAINGYKQANGIPSDVGFNPFAQSSVNFPSTHSLTDRPMGTTNPDDMMFDGITDAIGYRLSQVDSEAAAQLAKTGKKIPTRVHPTKADKNDFQAALQNAAAGHLPVRMWLFYEFLVHHGEIESNPRLDRDLFFYCEVLKFKEASHMFADEEILRRKVQSVSECYIDFAPATSSTMQIDISPEIQQKTLKAVQKYLAGKDFSATLFDEAMSSAFKEMLPYWVVFSRTYAPPASNRPIPQTRQLRERRKKLEEILRWKPVVPQTVTLPLLTRGVMSSNSFTYSLSDGIRWKVAGAGNVDDRSSSRGADIVRGGRSALSAIDEPSETSETGSRAKRPSVASWSVNDVTMVQNSVMIES